MEAVRTNLRIRLGGGETLQEMELALEQKLREGESLLVRGHSGAAIYLMGYAVEMTLKTAYFRYRGASPADPMPPMFAPAVHFARVRFPGIASPGGPPFRHYHDILFWGRLLRAVHRADMRNWPPEFDSQYLNAIRLLGRMWFVEMRYKPDLADAVQARIIQVKARWMARHRSLLSRKGL